MWMGLGEVACERLDRRELPRKGQTERATEPFAHRHEHRGRPRGIEPELSKATRSIDGFCRDTQFFGEELDQRALQGLQEMPVPEPEPDVTRRTQRPIGREQMDSPKVAGPLTVT